MSYITLSNAKSIVYKTDIKNIDIQKELYKVPIYFFSRYEKNALLAIRELLNNPEKYFLEIYEQPLNTEDTLTMVYEDYAPCYHEEHNCNRLNSDYKNYAIPTDIIEKGASEVKKFRIWFKTVEHYLESDVDIFQMRLKSRWDILTNVKAITADNSGNIKTDNRYIQNIENRIDRLIKSAGRFYYSSPKNTEILKAFSRLTFLAYKEQRIYNNKTGYSDTEVKSFLKYYDEK